MSPLNFGIAMTYLQMLQAELRDYEAMREAIALDPDKRLKDVEYKRKILAGWDHAISVKRAQIERETHATTI